MLRALVALLLLANLGFGAWTRGWLDDWVGMRARGDREPERLLNQVRPETVVILAPNAAAPAATATSATSATSAAPATPVADAASAAAPVCLEAGPFDAVQLSAVEVALRSLQPPVPDGSWVDQKTEQPASWLVYLGRYLVEGALARKEEELKRRNLSYEEVHLPGLDPGLSLGRFDSRAAAEAAMAALAVQGIRTARVVRAGEATTLHRLRIERADPALATRLSALATGASSSGFSACVTTGN